MKRSWPFCAEISDEALVLRSTRLMLSTITLLFFCPHSLVKVSLNHLSQAGTKWLHWQIFSVFCWAAAFSGNRKAGPSPAATAPAPVYFMKSLRDTPWPFFFFAISSSSISAGRQPNQISPLFSEPLHVFRYVLCHHRLVSLDHHANLLHHIR